MFNFPVFDYCMFALKEVKVNNFMRGFIKILKDALPDFVRICPYYGRLEMLNFTFNYDALVFISRGMYRFQIHQYNNDDHMSLFVSILFAKF